MCSSKNEHWKKVFPTFFEKTVVIKLNRIEEIENKSSKNDEKKLNNSSRITRSCTSQKNHRIEWVRITKGIYKGDLAKVVHIDDKKNEAHLQLFPRILFDKEVDESRRRPPTKLFDLDTIKYEATRSFHFEQIIETFLLTTQNTTTSMVKNNLMTCSQQFGVFYAYE